MQFKISASTPAPGTTRPWWARCALSTGRQGSLGAASPASAEKCSVVPRYHMKPAAALLVAEISRGLGAALRASYRGGRWFESTAAHHDCEYRTGLVPLVEVVLGLAMTTVLTTVLAITFGRICVRMRIYFTLAGWRGTRDGL